MLDRCVIIPDEVKTLVSIIKIREKCKRLDIDLFEAGLKGIIINFKEGKFKNTAGLIELIESDRKNISIKNNKLLIRFQSNHTNTILSASLKSLKNIDNFMKKNAPSNEGASY